MVYHSPGVYQVCGRNMLIELCGHPMLTWNFTIILPETWVLCHVPDDTQGFRRHRFLLIR